MNDVSAIERAFQLARTGEYPTIELIKKQLSREGYAQVELHLGGLLIKRQLREAMPIVSAKRTSGVPAV
jgi:hypothetical protein